MTATMALMYHAKSKAFAHNQVASAIAKAKELGRDALLTPTQAGGLQYVLDDADAMAFLTPEAHECVMALYTRLRTFLNGDPNAGPAPDAPPAPPAPPPATPTEPMAQTEKRDPPPPPPSPEPIKFRTHHDVSLLQVSAEKRKDKLDKMAADTRKEGYPTEARRFSNDAADIEYAILPLLKSQKELIGLAPEELRLRLNGFISNQLPEAMTKAKRAEVADFLDWRLEALLLRVADRAYSAGVTAREHEPGILTLRALEDVERNPPEKTPTVPESEQKGRKKG